MIETREVTIYEIVGVKVGQTTDIKRRMKKQGNQPYRVVQVIPPNTLTIRECWEQEQDWAIRLGYVPEGECNWSLIEYNKSDKVKQKPVTGSAAMFGKQHPNYKGTMVNSNGERFDGHQALKDAGYCPKAVNTVVNGRRKTHAGLKWWRETEELEKLQERKRQMNTETTVKDLNDILCDLKGLMGRISNEKRDVDIAMNKRFAFDDPEDFIEHLLDTLSDCKDFFDRQMDDLEQVEFYTKRIVDDIEMEQLSRVARKVA
jgi:hypothetical protein